MNAPYANTTTPKSEPKYDFPLNPRKSMYFIEPDIELNDIISLLNTISSQRQSAAIKTLQKLTRNIPFFRQLIADYEEKAHLDCCMCLKYFFLEKDSCVCKAGDIGDLFYIILQGNVQVLVPDETGRSLIRCTHLMAGCAFGEFALLKNKPRSATVITTENTHFAILSKKDFLRILGNFTNKKFDDMAKFLKSLPIFSPWGLNSLARLSYYFRTVKCKRNQKLFKEGDPAEYVFIVKSGEMELSKEIIVNNPCKVVIGNFGRPLPSLKKATSHHEGRMYIVGCGEIIGDDDGLNNEVYTQSCKCYSATAEIFQISSAEFKRRIRSEESLNILAEKTAFRNNHINSSVKIMQEIKTPKNCTMHAKSTTDLKIISDIKALNPWNSSMKGVKFSSFDVNHSHRPSYSITESISSPQQLLSPKSKVILKSLWT